ncbi:MAG TPA: type II secretion system minor pseudopilin GspK [Candidatus Binataceae bacterium]|nr:type II secretion system minor pseudopilin GspK [Candidatus Binataceae bacterium]
MVAHWRAIAGRIAGYARARTGRSERGVAMLAALLTISLMTILVVDFTTSSALGYRSAANQADELRALYLARSGIAAGMALLERDAIADALNNSPGHQPYDALTDIWAMPFPPVPIGGGTVSLVIVDESRKLSINRIYSMRTQQVDTNYVQVVARLFENIGVSTDLIPVLVDWLDPDSVESPGGAEADYYLQLMPPYEPRNAPMPTIGDLRACKGVDDATFAVLSRYLSASPETLVNPNTAPPEVLAALSPELSNSPGVVKEIIAARMSQPFMTVNDFANVPGVGQFAQKIMPLLTTRSSYFTIIGEGDFAGARRRVYASVRRNTNGSVMLLSWHED